MDGRSLWGWGPGTPRGHRRQTCCWFGTLSRAAEVSCRRARVQLITCRVSQALQKLSSQEAHSFAWTFPGMFSEHTGSVTEGCDLERNCERRSPRDKSGSCPAWGLHSTSSYWPSPRVTVHSARCRKPAVRGACPRPWQRTQGPGLLGSREPEWKGLPRGQVTRVTLSAHCELAGGPSAGQPWWAEAVRPLQSPGWGRASSASIRTGGFTFSGPGSSLCCFPSSASSPARGQLHVRAPGVWVLGEPVVSGV